MEFSGLLNYPAPEGDFAGRVILVTGAGSGIGAAVAAALGKAGARLILSGRTLAPLEANYDAIVQAGGDATLFPLDLESASYVDFERLASAISEEYRRLDGVFCNAAMLGDMTPAMRTDPQTWARVHQVNLHAPFMMLQNLIPLMLQSEDASVLMTLDPRARADTAYTSAYATSKSAAEKLLRLMALEYEQYPQLRVNGVAPPPMKTQLRRNAFPAEDSDCLPSPASMTAPFLYLLGGASRGQSGLIVQ